MTENALAEVLGLLGSGLWIYGMHMVGEEKRQGFIVGALGEVCMAAAGYALGAYFLVLAMGYLVLLDSAGWFWWDEIGEDD